MENDAVTNTGDNGGSRNPLVRPLDDSVDDEVQNLGRRDDPTSLIPANPNRSSSWALLNPDTINYNELRKLKVHSTRGDTLTLTQEEEFEKILESFCRRIIGETPMTDKIFAGFYMSMCQAIVNQGTSVKAAGNNSLENYFEVDGARFKWKTPDLINEVRPKMSDVPNAIRRYARSHEKIIQDFINSGLIKPDYHLQFKHGVLPSHVFGTGDYINGSLMNISDDQLISNLLMKRNALCKGNEGKELYNVNQLASITGC
uniref:CP n=1 Tax=Tomato chlorosis virus TaxID=67754 RepID=A0A088FRS9_9CLOS|nr:CP [Tomato chlorosis virus]AHH44938.1 CP [Tomato chlorosis virus]AIM47761.1 CP [Tomato chlorosis virus]WOL52789.1 coat protein [Tomato chlorosis virus]